MEIRGGITASAPVGGAMDTRSTIAHATQRGRPAADHVGVTGPSFRIRLVCLPALFAALLVAAPAAEAKPKPRGAACAKASGSLRPSPLRSCVRTRKAPKALPAASGDRRASRSPKRRRASDAGSMAMMG